MTYEKITCRIAIQTCVGHFPDGRERHRTFSLRHVRPDVSPEAIRKIIRALAPVLKYPITKVTKVVKMVLFSAEEEQAAEGRVTRAAIPSHQVDAAPVSAEPVLAEPIQESGRIIPFPIFPTISSRKDESSRKTKNADLSSRNKEMFPLERKLTQQLLNWKRAAAAEPLLL